jgi:hypothetical protein
LNLQSFDEYLELYESDDGISMDLSRRGLRDKARKARKKRRTTESDRRQMRRAFRRSKIRKRGKPYLERYGLQKLLKRRNVIDENESIDDVYSPNRAGGRKLLRDTLKVVRQDKHLAKKKLMQSFRASQNKLGWRGEKKKEQLKRRFPDNPKKQKLTRRQKQRIRRKNKSDPRFYRNTPYYWALVKLKKNWDKLPSKED